MISPDSIRRIEASPVWRARRVEWFELPEGRVLVKGQRARRSPWPHHWLNGLAWMAGVSYMKAVPVHGGADSQATEVMRLRALHSAGVPVPEVHHVGEDYFVMADMGPNDLARTLREQGSGAFSIWMAAMEALLHVHAQGQYLSQCFARNIIVADNRFQGLIDFEDDPLEVMNLVEAQARDWLIFLQSTLFNLALEPHQLDAALRSVLERESAAVRAKLRHAAGRLAWMRWLPTSRTVWGKDFVSLQATGAALYRHHFPERIIWSDQRRY